MTLTEIRKCCFPPSIVDLNDSKTLFTSPHSATKRSEIPDVTTPSTAQEMNVGRGMLLAFFVAVSLELPHWPLLSSFLSSQYPALGQFKSDLFQSSTLGFCLHLLLLFIGSLTVAMYMVETWTSKWAVLPLSCKYRLPNCLLVLRVCCFGSQSISRTGGLWVILLFWFLATYRQSVNSSMSVAAPSHFLLSSPPIRACMRLS